MERVAIIGTGVAGLACGWFLRDHYDLTVFERNGYAGGHTNTVTVTEPDGREVPIDTGFMVYNRETYPNLVRFFEELAVPVMATTMSFSVQDRRKGLIEYGGADLNQLFGQRRNLLRPVFWRLLADIQAFFRDCDRILAEEERWQSVTVREYARSRGYGRAFLESYLLPMSSAIWSSPADAMLDFPLLTLVRFFHNHGLIGTGNHLQWYTPRGGSRVYRDKITAALGQRLHLNRGATSVRRLADGLEVTDAQGSSGRFDRVILATHADEALALLADPTPLERQRLAPFRYQENAVILHTDPKVMPERRRIWSSWNYRIEPGPTSGEPAASTIYWMNSLQKVSDRQDYFVSVNDPGRVDPHRILKRITYTHPLFDLPAIQAQSHLAELNQADSRTFFCGSYFKYGFHEDALNAGLAVVRQLLPGDCGLWASGPTA